MTELTGQGTALTKDGISLWQQRACKWEYHAVVKVVNQAGTIVDTMNAQGADGWELVGFYPQSDSLLYIYKRPKADDDEG